MYIDMDCSCSGLYYFYTHNEVCQALAVRGLNGHYWPRCGLVLVQYTHVL